MRTLELGGQSGGHDAQQGEVFAGVSEQGAGVCIRCDVEYFTQGDSVFRVA
jgi:formate-dependent nitrite reductase cytochrome c552 subunit